MHGVRFWLPYLAKQICAPSYPNADDLTASARPDFLEDDFNVRSWGHRAAGGGNLKLDGARTDGYLSVTRVLARAPICCSPC